jgi:adenylate kinase family enzyme
MERVAILGCSGSGKTRAAHELARRTGLPIVHLDVLFWRPGWVPADEAQARAALEAAVAEPRWILDGNFLGDAPDGRFARADTVVFLDVGRLRCLARVLRRLVRDRRRRRPDLPEGCGETLSPALLRWIWRYPHQERPAVLALLERLEATGVAVYRVRDASELWVGVSG